MAVPRDKCKGAEVPLVRTLFSKWHLLQEDPLLGNGATYLPNTDHYVFNSNPGCVIREMYAFLPDLP